MPIFLGPGRRWDPVRSPQAVSAKSPRQIRRRGRRHGAPWSDLPGEAIGAEGRDVEGEGGGGAVFVPWLCLSPVAPDDAIARPETREHEINVSVSALLYFR